MLLEVIYEFAHRIIGGTLSFQIDEHQIQCRVSFDFLFPGRCRGLLKMWRGVVVFLPPFPLSQEIACSIHVYTQRLMA